MDKTERIAMNYRAILIGGLCGCTLLTAMLLAAGALMPIWGMPMQHTALTGKGCLLISGAVCAIICSKGAPDKKIQHCLIAQLLLLAYCIVGTLAVKGEVGFLSACIDALLLGFGCFAGGLSINPRTKKALKQKKYRK